MSRAMIGWHSPAGPEVAESALSLGCFLRRGSEEEGGGGEEGGDGGNTQNSFLGLRVTYSITCCEGRFMAPRNS